MSSLPFVSEQEYEEHHGHAPPHRDEHQDHNHNSIGRPGSGSNPTEPPQIIEITAVQRMLAACSGSLLTSLLVTPLDVIRVRLQAQQSAPQPLRVSSLPQAPISVLSESLPTPSRLAGSAHPATFQNVFSRLPPTLGVTACCREVFWINNQAEFCVANGSGGSAAASIETCAHEEANRRQFKGTWEGMVKIARNEGITTLWRGLSPTLLMTVPSNVIYFTAYDSMRTSPNSPFSNARWEYWAPLMAGGSARALAATAISPMELFRTRLWATSSEKGKPSPFRQTLTGLGDMVKAEGVTSLWRGLTMTLWRDVPFSAIYWLGYEKGREALARGRSRYNDHGSSTNTFIDSFVAGAGSGAIAAFITQPFDVGKTKAQIMDSKPAAKASQLLGRGFISTADNAATLPQFLMGIVKEEGIQGLWKGVTPRVLKVAPACAIMISSYEVGKKLALKVNNKHLDEDAL